MTSGIALAVPDEIFRRVARAASRLVKLQRPNEGHRVQSLPLGTCLPQSFTFLLTF